MTYWFFGGAGWAKSRRKFIEEIKKDPFGDYDQPRMAANIGVFGTFIGITLGLLTFDTNDLEASIPKMLGGMTTAFFTSLYGMGLSFYMKRIQEKAQELYNGNAVISDNANIADLIKYLQDREIQKVENDKKILTCIESNNSMLKETIATSIEKMTISLVGDGESTLIGQMKLMRSEVADNQRALKAEFLNGSSAIVLLYKRLESGRFQWPSSPEEVRTLSSQEFRWLMEGLSIDQPKAVKKISVTSCI